MKREGERPARAETALSERSSLRSSRSRRERTARFTKGWIFYRSSVTQELVPDPALHAPGVERGTPGPTPAREPSCADTGDVGADRFTEPCPPFTLGIDESDEKGRATCIDFMARVRPHQRCAAPFPPVTRSVTNPQRSVYRGHKLHTVMPMPSGRKAGSPHEQRGRPDKRTQRSRAHHARQLWHG